MKRTTLLAVLIPALAAMAAGPALAQPSINVVGAPPWTLFSSANSDELIFVFERDPALPPPDDITVVPMALPAAGAAFTVTKDGAPCAVGDSGNCSGSDVSTFAGPFGDLQILNDGEAAAASDFSIRIASSLGNWQVNATTNAAIASVHAIPDVVVDAPAQVASAAVGVTMDGGGSHSTFAPAAMAPAIVSYAWSQVSGTPVTLTAPAAAETRFDAPAVVADEDLIFALEVSDGILTASEQVTVTVSPPQLPVDAVLAIDTSGSMGWHRTGSANDLAGGCCSRLSSAKLAARSFVERLGTLAASSEVAVVIFPGTAGLQQQWSPAAGLETAANFPDVISDIGAESLPSCGDCVLVPGVPGAPTGIGVNWNGTPTRCGLDEARTALTAASPAGTRTRVIVLLSDGAWNSCNDPADAAYLAGLVGDDIYVYAIGMGTGADNVNHASLQDISVGTGVGIALNPIGFTTYEFGDAASEPNLLPHFEKIMADMASLDFTLDPADAISSGETDTHTLWVSEHDRTVSVTVSWESSTAGLLDMRLQGPGGQVVRPQVSGNGYRNATLLEVQGRPGQVGEWLLEVTYPEVPTEPGVEFYGSSTITYNYSVVVDSALGMDVVLDRDRYFTGSEMKIEARLVEDNRRLPGAEVTATVRRPEDGIGSWHLQNQVSKGQIDEVADLISGEPMTLLDKKNYVLLQQQGAKLPPTVADPVVPLNDEGESGDRQAGDGIYTGRYAGFTVPGVYRFSIAATGTTSGGNTFTREAQFHRFVEVALTPDGLAGALTFEAAVPGPFFPGELVEMLRGEPPAGFERKSAVFRPVDSLGNPWGPGQASKIHLASKDVELVGGVVDRLDGSYVQIIQFRSGSGPSIQVEAGGVSSPVISVEEPTGTGVGPLGIPWWVWLLLLLLLVVVVVVFMRRH